MQETRTERQRACADDLMVMPGTCHTSASPSCHTGDSHRISICHVMCIDFFLNAILNVKNNKNHFRQH